MEYVGWKFNVVAPDEQESLCGRLRSLVCQSLNLCTSVGCACVVGEGEQLCEERDGTGRFGVWSSAGPHWSVLVIRLDVCVKLDVYFTGPVIPHELRDLHQRIVDNRRYPVFQSSGMGATGL